ncbi:hypothetical protein JTE90_023236 [Oedothorax gibbosus]|uniref:Integrase catalytic domain-containing protein n=1 Tax=Oedothorax gibbosus TaxID=931172 RepID=A0AAV6TQM7_9ARAC|nr:hypothetical protein JTE90_023236 [Oedothorax gibbosus]
MKSIARSLLWWPNLDLDIDDRVRTCNECIQNAHMPPKHLQPWPTAARVWSRIHIDYAGPVDGHMILVVQDAHSKWIEAVAVRNATTAVTIEKLYEIFARFGFPGVLLAITVRYSDRQN